MKLVAPSSREREGRGSILARDKPSLEPISSIPRLQVAKMCKGWPLKWAMRGWCKQNDQKNTDNYIAFFLFSPPSPLLPAHPRGRGPHDGQRRGQHRVQLRGRVPGGPPRAIRGAVVEEGEFL